MKLNLATISILALGVALPDIGARAQQQPLPIPSDPLTRPEKEYLDSLPPVRCNHDCEMKAAYTIERTNNQPLCIVTEEQAKLRENEPGWPSPADLANMYKCYYNDKIYVNAVMGCLVEECPQSDLPKAIEYFYAYAWYFTQRTVFYPPPPDLLSILCIPPPTKAPSSVPTTFPEMEQGLGYNFPEKFPEQTATTWIPPQFTGREDEYKDTRKALTCSSGASGRLGREGFLATGLVVIGSLVASVGFGW